MYIVCPYCGSCLDPSEICDCRKNAALDVQDPEAAQMKIITNNLADPNNFVNKKENTNGYCQT